MKHPGINPYENLVIYYCSGVLKESSSHFDIPSFIGTWVEEGSSFIFFSSSRDSDVDDLISQNKGMELVEKYEMKCEQWHGDKILPYFVDDICIHPPWQLPEKGSDDFLKIILDPGVVFGTGRHQTTEDCLVLIQRLFKKHEIKSILDIGTGTGLLSLGAAVLGCKKVLACDFNFLAVKTTANNIRLNSFEERILAFQARGEEVISLHSELLVANIHYAVMKDIIDSDGFLEKKWFILSGLLNSEVKKVLKKLEEKPVHVIERRCPDGIWNTIYGKVLN